MRVQPQKQLRRLTLNSCCQHALKWVEDSKDQRSSCIFSFRLASLLSDSVISFHVCPLVAVVGCDHRSFNSGCHEAIWYVFVCCLFYFIFWNAIRFRRFSIPCWIKLQVCIKTWPCCSRWRFLRPLSCQQGVLTLMEKVHLRLLHLQHRNRISSWGLQIVHFISSSLLELDQPVQGRHCGTGWAEIQHKKKQKRWQFAWKRHREGSAVVSRHHSFQAIFWQVENIKCVIVVLLFSQFYYCVLCWIVS